MNSSVTKSTDTTDSHNALCSNAGGFFMLSYMETSMTTTQHILQRTKQAITTDYGPDIERIVRAFAAAAVMAFVAGYMTGLWAKGLARQVAAAYGAARLALANYHQVSFDIDREMRLLELALPDPLKMDFLCEQMGWTLSIRGCNTSTLKANSQNS